MFYDHNLTVTAVAEAYGYGRTRRASRARIARQNVVARKDRMGRTLAVFLTADEHAGLLARGRALLERKPADLVATVNVGSALCLLEQAETSWKRPGSVVVMVNHADAVLLGNVFRRLNGFGLGLARLDEIAVRQPPAGTPFDVFAHELIAALEALDATGEARAATVLRTATAGSTTWRIHVAPADAGWLLESLRAVGAPHRLLVALAPISAAAEGVLPDGLVPVPGHHGIELILDDAGEPVGQVERDPYGNAWHVSACPQRFPEASDLPARFLGCTEAWIPKRGDLLRFLEIPLPGFAACEAEPERRAA